MLSDLANKDSGQPNNLVDTLAKAMAARHIDMRVDDNDSGDEWSD